MAKSAKKTAKKIAKKIVRKATKKAVAKVVKAPLKKVAKKAAKKPAKKTARKSAPKSVKKSVQKPAPKPGRRYLIIYHSPVDVMAQGVGFSPEQQAAGMALWKAWADRVGSKLTDMGAPLINGQRVTAEGSPAPSTKEVTGYSLLEAEDWEEVWDLLNDHPHLSGLDPEATIEVHETVFLPGM